MRARGFTLIELLIAVTVVAIMAALAYGGLNGLIRQYDQTEERVARMVALQRTLALLSSDLSQVQPRPVREEFHGDQAGALVASGDEAEFALELTRGGWSNPGRQRRATLQRVAWRLLDGRIERAHWQLLDRAQSADPVLTPLLEDVERLEWRFMDRQGEWDAQWPPAGGATAELPRAVEVTLLLTDETEVRRVFALHE